MKKFLLVCIVLISSSLAFGKVEASSYGVLDDETSRTLLPVRAVSESLGLKVGWDNSTRTVTIGEKYQMQIGNENVYEKGKIVYKLLAKPKIINGSTYVPVRDITVLFNSEIEWDAKNYQVHLINNEKEYIYPVFPEKIVMKPKMATSMKTFNVNNKKLSAKIVEINMLAPNTSIQVELANNTLNTVNSLASIVQSHGAAVGINGNYFDAYTEAKTVYNGLVMNGKIARTFDLKFPVFYATESGVLGILPGAAFLEKFNTEKVDPIAEALQVGPRLMTDGKITINPTEEGFRDPKILVNSAMRSAVGFTKERQLILLTVPNARIGEVAEIMRQLGAYQAMNLDGGASSGLYVNGQYLTIPGRQIAVGLLVK